MTIRFFIKNTVPNLPPRNITVDVAAYLSPTKEKVIDWVKKQQPYLIEGEKWEVVEITQVMHY